MSEKERNDAKKGEDKGKPGHGKRILLRTFGCQMNDYDSAKLASLLAEHGYKKTDAPRDADFIMVNTCSVRQNAEDRAIAFLSTHKPLKKEGRKLCLLGCTANLHGEKLLKKYRFIDIVCGPNNYKDMPAILKEAKKGCFTGDEGNPFIEVIPETKGSISSPVTITKGCENFCSYCVVPFTRGKLTSKPPEKIFSEIEALAEKGVKEIILLGQNVNEYGKDSGGSFPQLLQSLNGIDKIARIGFTTSHPKDIPDELLHMIKNLPKVYEHLHLPLQSGSDRILKLMNRRYNLAKYKAIIKKAREEIPGISITSDIITGYPSETEEEFYQTCEAVREIEFDDLFVFKYSSRPGTAAAQQKDDVPTAEKERRHRLILELQDENSYKKNRGYAGKRYEVFVRSASSKKEGFWIGRTISNKPVFFKSANCKPGDVAEVKVTKARRRYLEGRLCGGAHKEGIK